MVTRGIFSYLNSYYLSWVSFHILRDLRSELFRHLMSSRWPFSTRPSPASSSPA